MRIFALALLTTAVVACAPTAHEPGSTPPSSLSPAPRSTTTTVAEALADSITLRLDDVEGLAVDRGVRLEITSENGQPLGWLDRDHPEIEVDSSTPKLTIRYVAADGEPTSTVWEQPIRMPVTIIRQPWRGDGKCVVTLPDGSSVPVALVWQSGGDTSAYLHQLAGANGEVSVVSPIWWRIASDGTAVSTTDTGYVEAVHDQNVAIWPAVAGFDADTLHLVLSNRARRSTLARQISEEALEIGADGVNIDVEGYREEDSETFLAWVEELTGLVHEWGGLVSYDLVPRSDTWDVSPSDLAFWSTAPPRSELSRVTDCTVLMAYDEHNGYRPAGPVASPPWVEEVLVHALRHSDPAQLVLGIPFYARIWDPTDLERPAAVGLDDLDPLIDAGEVTHDPVYDLERVELLDGRFFWAETPGGLEHRFELVADYGLAGWAAWRFGFDGPAIWEVVGEAGSGGSGHG